VSDVIYPSAKELMMTGQLDLVNDPVVGVLVNTTLYTFSSNHAWLADVPSAAQIAMSGTLTGRTVTQNVFDADDANFGSVTGLPVQAVVLAKYTGVPASSPLICHLDQAVTGLPLNPDGSVVNVIWSNGTNRIFAL